MTATDAQQRRLLSREQIMDRIITINTSATRDFLESFRSESLAAYLDHLTIAQGPRGRASRRPRSDDSPAIVVRSTSI